MMADVIVNAKVTSSTPPAGTTQGAIGVAGIIKKPLKDGSVIKVTNLDEAKRKLGGHMPESTLLYGLEKIFKKLGKVDVYVAPVLHVTAVGDPSTMVGKSASVTVGDTGAVNDIFDAEVNYLGMDGNKFAIRISDVDTEKTNYSVEIISNGVVQGQKIKEVTNLTFLEKVAHADITFTILVNDNAIIPATGTYEFAGGVDAHTDANQSDFDDAINKLVGKPLDFVLVDSTLASNGQTAGTVAGQMNAVAFVNTPIGTTDEGAIAHRNLFDSKFVQVFHPHQFESDPLGNKNKPNRAIPIAYEAVANYILAHRAVGRRQVGAGLEYGRLTGLGLTQAVDGSVLSDTGVNYAVAFENEGTFVWDAMTASVNIDWADANRIHLFNFIQKTLTPLLRPDLFKASDETVWQNVRTRLNVPMKNLFQKGEFYSEDGSEAGAYFIQCDETNNSREEQLSKKMNVKVGYKDKQMIKWIVLDIEVA